ncbi:MAG: aspartate ammonia-lyase [Ectothiorhodospiraceae bacterium]|nr:aspartate ammonia-lyase [Ectothiorhodospiraceae bacterium]
MNNDTATRAVRIEKDSLGSMEVPSNAYYGIQTQRALLNFPISGMGISQFPHLLRALALVKKASAHANMEMKILPVEIGEAISHACDDVLQGDYHDQFIVDVFQGGAGTSTNMNANEVIANIALEYLGKQKGEYQYCHPNDHVNLSQSTNDVYPTATQLALYTHLDELTTTMGELKNSFELKEVEFADIIKMGRTQLQDAVPMTLGQEFSTYASMIGEDIKRIHEAKQLLREMNLGATAIGTGLNAPEGYTDRVRLYLNEFAQISFVTAANLIEETQDVGVLVQLSGVLKRFAVKLSKTCNDLRLLSSGPRAGLNEINLPPMQPGSSIMPGKVNPVIPEVVNQICFTIIGNDVTISMAAEAGQLQLNVMEPVMFFCLSRNIDLLQNGCRTLARRCINGITANREICRMNVERSIGLVTALSPILGYEVCSEIAKDALGTGKSITEIIRERGLMTEEELETFLKPENMTKPSFLRK